MGITGYYWKFIEGFSKIANPIPSLQKMEKRFLCDLRCDESFNKSKELLTTAHILKIAHPKKDFVVCTDACNEGLGGVLTQEGHIIVYESSREAGAGRIIFDLGGNIVSTYSEGLG